MRPSMSLPSLLRLVVLPFLVRLRLRLSSMSRIASQNSLTTAWSLGEPAAVAADLARLVVGRFDAVGGVHHPAEHGREPRERDEPVLRAFPRGGRRRVSPAELAFRELAERLFRGLPVGRAVHAPERRAHPLPVVVGDEPVGRAYQVHHAGLHDRLGPRGLHGLGQALEPVAAHDQRVGHAPVGHLGAHVRPEGGAPVVLDPYARHMLEPVHVDADGDVRRLGRHPAVVARLDPDGVQVQDRIELVQRPLLPFGHGVAHRVGDVGYRLGAQVRADRLPKVVLDVAHRHAARVQGYDHLVQCARPPGTLGHRPRGERAVPAVGNLHGRLSRRRGRRLGIRTVARVRMPAARLRLPVAGRVAQMRRHLGLQAAFPGDPRELARQAAVAGELDPPAVYPFEQGIQRAGRDQRVHQGPRIRHGAIVIPGHIVGHRLHCLGHHDRFLSIR